MKCDKVTFHWIEPKAASCYRTGVSLHSHTLHSHESLSFVPQLAARIPLLARELCRLEAKYRTAKKRDFDFQGSYWIPPVTAHAAYDLERAQIESQLNLFPLVSLTDHDSIEAGCQLQLRESNIPISVEWTVPIGATYFHFGVHNIPPAEAREWMVALASFSANAAESRLRDLFDRICSYREVLVVLNHPFWDQTGQGAAAHLLYLKQLCAVSKGFIHAIELNGLRPWDENRRAAAFARSLGLPLVSGGDRHGLEPNATLNLTNAGDFAGFAEELRAGVSQVLVMPQYREPLPLRCMQTLCDVIREYPDWAGYQRWSDRIFYSGSEGKCVPIASAMTGDGPAVLQYFVSAACLLGRQGVQRALRTCLSIEREFAL